MLRLSRVETCLCTWLCECLINFSSDTALTVTLVAPGLPLNHARPAAYILGPGSVVPRVAGACSACGPSCTSTSRRWRRRCGSRRRSLRASSPTARWPAQPFLPTPARRNPARCILPATYRPLAVHHCATRTTVPRAPLCHAHHCATRRPSSKCTSSP